MLPCRDIHIQLVDTPPISNPGTQSRLYGLLRNSAVFVVVVELSHNAVEQVQQVLSELGQWGFQMVGSEDDGPDGEDRWHSKPTVLVGNKADIPGALDQLRQGPLGGYLSKPGSLAGRRVLLIKW